MYQARFYKDNAVAIKEQVAQYRKENAEAIKAHAAQYRKENVAAIEAKQSAIITCACGSQHRTDSKARHIRSAKHCTWLETEALKQTAL